MIIDNVKVLFFFGRKSSILRPFYTPLLAGISSEIMQMINSFCWSPMTNQTLHLPNIARVPTSSTSLRTGYSHLLFISSVLYHCTSHSRTCNCATWRSQSYVCIFMQVSIGITDGFSFDWMCGFSKQTVLEPQNHLCRECWDSWQSMSRNPTDQVFGKVQGE